MTPTETVALTEYVQACCPQQAMGEYTPDAWYDLLGDIELADCIAAVKVVCKRQPFIAPAEIRTEVRRIRNDRLAREIVPAPPAELTDEPGRYKAAIQAGVRRISDGFSVRRAIGRSPAGPPPSAIEARKSLGPALPRPERTLPSREIARRQVAESRAERGAPVNVEPEEGEPAA